MNILGITTSISIVRKYTDLDNYELANKPIPAIHTLVIGESGVEVREFNTEDLFFTKLNTSMLGSVTAFDTNKPTVYGNNLRLKFIGVYNNKIVPTIYLGTEDANDNIYVFEDIFNNGELVYIPESVIEINSLTVTGNETKVMVKCKTPEELSILYTLLKSVNIEYMLV